MASRRNKPIKLPAPNLRRVWLDADRVKDPAVYPFCLPFLLDEFELSFDRAVTIIVGENGMGKSTLLEGIATLSGFDEAGGAGGYKPVDHSDAIEVMGGKLSSALCAGWLPKVSNGWFFRAESFFSVARYLDKVQSEFIPGVGTGRPHRTSSRIPTVKASFGSSRSVASDRHFYLRRAGIGAIAVTADRVSKTAPAHGRVPRLPSHHGHPFVDAHGVSPGATAAAIEVRAGASHGSGDRPLQGHAGVL